MKSHELSKYLRRNIWRFPLALSPHCDGADDPVIVRAPGKDFMQILAPLGVLTSVAVSLAIIADCSFYGIATTAIVAWIGTIAGICVALGFAAACRDPWALALAVIVFAAPAAIFLWPVSGDLSNIVLVDAGDFNQYVGLGSWFTSHAITEPAHLGSDFNTIQINLMYHQMAHLRLGTAFLLSTFSSLTGREAAQVYSIFSGATAGLQATGLYLFSLCAFRRIPAPGSAIIAILYALSPNVTWPTYASFLPQTIGIAFALGCVGIYISAARVGGLMAAALTVPFGLLFFATLSTYPECIPVVVAICGLFTMFAIASMKTRRRYMLGIGRFLIIGIMVAVFVSSPTATWAFKGFIYQITALPHGGPQVTTAAKLIEMLFAATRLPLIADLVMQTHPVVRVLGLIATLCAICGVFFNAWRGERHITWAIATATAILFAAVRIKYAQVPNVSPPEAATILTWNLFKSAQYAAPFVFAVGASGLIAIAMSAPRLSWLLTTPLISLLVVAIAEDDLIMRRAYVGRIDPAFITFLRGLPPDGRLLISLQGHSYYYRYVIYSVLRNRPFISTEDWQPIALYSDPSSAFMSTPISYVLSDRAGAIPDLPVLMSFDDLNLLDAKDKVFTHTVDIAGSPILLRSSPDGLHSSQVKP